MEYINEQFKIFMREADFYGLFITRYKQILNLWYTKAITKKDAIKMVKILQRNIILLQEQECLKRAEQLQKTIETISELDEDQARKWLYESKSDDKENNA